MTAHLKTQAVVAAASTCPVCELAATAQYFDLGNRQFFRCADCRTVFQFPLPSLDQARIVHTDRYDGATRGYFAKVDKKTRQARFEMSMLRQLVKRDARFLDIGCNGGFMVTAAGQVGFDAHGVDIDPVSVAYAREHCPSAKFYVGSAEQLPADIGQFDLIYCSEVIEHVPQARDFLFAIARLLKPRGFLYLTTPNIYHWSVPRDIRQFKALRSNGHCMFYNPAGLRQAFRKVGIDYRFSIPNAKPGMRMVFRKQQ